MDKKREKVIKEQEGLRKRWEDKRKEIRKRIKKLGEKTKAIELQGKKLKN